MRALRVCATVQGGACRAVAGCVLPAQPCSFVAPPLSQEGRRPAGQPQRERRGRGAAARRGGRRGRAPPASAALHHHRRHAQGVPDAGHELAHPPVRQRHQRHPGRRDGGQGGGRRAHGHPARACSRRGLRPPDLRGSHAHAGAGQDAADHLACGLPARVPRHPRPPHGAARQLPPVAARTRMVCPCLCLRLRNEQHLHSSACARCCAGRGAQVHAGQLVQRVQALLPLHQGRQVHRQPGGAGAAACWPRAVAAHAWAYVRNCCRRSSHTPAAVLLLLAPS